MTQPDQSPSRSLLQEAAMYERALGVLLWIGLGLVLIVGF